MPGSAPDYTGDELIEGLQALADGLGQRPTQKQMRLEGPYSINAYKRAFGSWNGAIEAAGFEPNTRGQAVTKEKLIQTLRKLADKLGRSPSQSDINEHSDHSHKTYYRKFDGGLAEAKERAGLEHKTAPQDVELVEITCAYCGNTEQRTPSDVEKNKINYCDMDCYYADCINRFSGDNNHQWNSVELECSYCGETIYRPMWDAKRYDNHFCPDSNCYGQWRSELMDGGYAPIHDREFPTGPDHFRYKADKITYMGPNWPEQQLKAIKRDQARCQEVNCDENGMTQTEKHGSDVPVHHITPRERFWDGETFDYESANQLDNLICLCRSHHRKRHA